MGLVDALLEGGFEKENSVGRDHCLYLYSRGERRLLISLPERETRLLQRDLAEPLRHLQREFGDEYDLNMPGSPFKEDKEFRNIYPSILSIGSFSYNDGIYFFKYTPTVQDRFEGFLRERLFVQGLTVDRELFERLRNRD